MTLEEEEEYVEEIESLRHMLKMEYLTLSPRLACIRLLSGGRKYKASQLLKLMSYRGYTEQDCKHACGDLIDDRMLKLSKDEDMYLSLRDPNDEDV